MRNVLPILIISALTSTAFAATSDLESGDSKNCAAIAKACRTAGYVQHADASSKRFWQDCMRPLILGMPVKEVPIDASQGEACRMDKIIQLKADLKDLEENKKV